MGDGQRSGKEIEYLLKLGGQFPDSDLFTRA